MQRRSLTWCVAFLFSFEILWAGPGTNEQKRVNKPAVARRIGVEEFEKLWRDKKNILLDVRTKREFDAGHIPGAMQIDFNGADFEQKIRELDKSKVYLVHCAAGVRSARACVKMSNLGFTNLVDLGPGFTEWQKAGKPVEK